MTSLLSWPPLPIPIPTHLRERSPADSNDRNYQHRLVTNAVAAYLQMIAVPHRLETSPIGSRLYINEIDGYVGCCPVPPNAEKCAIPTSNRENCKGFLFVELAPPYYRAQILGFVDEVTASELPLSYLQPLTAFTAFLEAESAKSSLSYMAISTWAKEQLSGWLSLHNVLQDHLSRELLPPRISRTWAMRGNEQSPSTRLYERYATAEGDASLVQSLSKMEPTAALAQIIEQTTDETICWQAAEQLAYADSRHPLVSAIQIKPLADELDGLAVALLLGVVARPDDIFLVGCRLYATATQQALPEGLVLIGTEEPTAADSSVFCEMTPAVDGDPLAYLFTAQKGDRFSYQVRYQGLTATSRFVL